MAYDTLDVLPSGQFTVNTPPIDVNGKSLFGVTMGTYVIIDVNGRGSLGGQPGGPFTVSYVTRNSIYGL